MKFALAVLVLGSVAVGQTTTRVSVSTAGGQANFDCYSPSLSSDGRFVAFESLANNLVVGDTNGKVDVFVRDTQTGVTERVSVSSSGAEGNGNSVEPSISGDGRYVAFYSGASNLIPGVVTGAPDVFVHDRVTGQTTLASVDSTGAPGSGQSAYVEMSDDGRFVAFESFASNLVAGDTNGVADIFRHDLQTGATIRVNVSSAGVQATAYTNASKPALSSDGRYVTFRSNDGALAPGGSGFGDIYVHDSATGQTRCVSVGLGGNAANAMSWGPSISADGGVVVFESVASNLVPNDTNGCHDVFAYDANTSAITRVSLSSGGTQASGDSGTSWYRTLSADGRFCIFESDAANLVAIDTNGTEDIFWHDRLTGETVLASMDTLGTQGDNLSWLPTLSADGRSVAFSSYADNLATGDTNGVPDVFLRTPFGCPPLLTFYRDADGDGYGDPNLTTTGCTPPPGYVLNGIDCDDSNPSVHPGTVEVCNGIDDDCNGLVDDGYIGPYCTAKTNSLSCLPSIGYVGWPSQSGPDNFYVTAINVLNNKLGMMLWSLGQANNPFFGGILCLQQPIVRTAAQMSGGTSTGNDCSGTYSYHFSQGYMLQHLLAGNTTVYAQYWSRDPGFSVPNNIGLTDGLSFTVCP